MVANDLRSILTSMERKEAEERLRRTVQKYTSLAPELAAWMEQAVPKGLTVFDLPESHRSRLRTTSLLERLNWEINRKRRWRRSSRIRRRYLGWSWRCSPRSVTSWKVRESISSWRASRKCYLNAFTEEWLLYPKLHCWSCFRSIFLASCLLL